MPFQTSKELIRAENNTVKLFNVYQAALSETSTNQQANPIQPTTKGLEYKLSKKTANNALIQLYKAFSDLLSHSENMKLSAKTQQSRETESHYQAYNDSYNDVWLRLKAVLEHADLAERLITTEAGLWLAAFILLTNEWQDAVNKKNQEEVIELLNLIKNYKNHINTDFSQCMAFLFNDQDNHYFNQSDNLIRFGMLAAGINDCVESIEDYIDTLKKLSPHLLCLNIEKVPFFLENQIRFKLTYQLTKSLMLKAQNIDEIHLGIVAIISINEVIELPSVMFDVITESKQMAFVYWNRHIIKYCQSVFIQGVLTEPVKQMQSLFAEAYLISLMQVEQYISNLGGPSLLENTTLNRRAFFAEMVISLLHKRNNQSAYYHLMEEGVLAYAISKGLLPKTMGTMVTPELLTYLGKLFPHQSELLSILINAKLFNAAKQLVDALSTYETFARELSMQTLLNMDSGSTIENKMLGFLSHVFDVFISIDAFEEKYLEDSDAQEILMNILEDYAKAIESAIRLYDKKFINIGYEKVFNALGKLTDFYDEKFQRQFEFDEIMLKNHRKFKLLSSYIDKLNSLKGQEIIKSIGVFDNSAENETVVLFSDALNQPVIVALDSIEEDESKAKTKANKSEKKKAKAKSNHTQKSNKTSPNNDKVINTEDKSMAVADGDLDLAFDLYLSSEEDDSDTDDFVARMNSFKKGYNVEAPNYSEIRKYPKRKKNFSKNVALMSEKDFFPNEKADNVSDSGSIKALSFFDEPKANLTIESSKSDAKLSLVTTRAESRDELNAVDITFGNFSSGLNFEKNEQALSEHLKMPPNYRPEENLDIVFGSFTHDEIKAFQPGGKKDTLDEKLSKDIIDEAKEKSGKLESTKLQEDIKISDIAPTVDEMSLNHQLFENKINIEEKKKRIPISPNRFHFQKNPNLYVNRHRIPPFLLQLADAYYKHFNHYLMLKGGAVVCYFYGMDFQMADFDPLGNVSIEEFMAWLETKPIEGITNIRIQGEGKNKIVRFTGLDINGELIDYDYSFFEIAHQQPTDQERLEAAIKHVNNTADTTHSALLMVLVASLLLEIRGTHRAIHALVTGKLDGAIKGKNYIEQDLVSLFRIAKYIFKFNTLSTCLILSKNLSKQIDEYDKSNHFASYVLDSKHQGHIGTALEEIYKRFPCNELDFYLINMNVYSILSGISKQGLHILLPIHLQFCINMAELKNKPLSANERKFYLYWFLFFSKCAIENNFDNYQTLPIWYVVKNQPPQLKRIFDTVLLEASKDVSTLPLAENVIKVLDELVNPIKQHVLQYRTYMIDDKTNECYSPRRL